MKTNPIDPISACEKEVMGPHGQYTKEMLCGLSKREYFAAMAMQGLLHLDWDVLENAARRSVEIADALIEALNKE